MNYLVDTNVISELRKPHCNENVRACIERLPPESLSISVISLGEIRYGIARLEDSPKKIELTIWFDTQLLEWFERRIIPLDTAAAIEWGIMRARHQKTLPAADSFLAAAALSRRLTILTRNVKDFEQIEGISVINPWDYAVHRINA